MKGTTRYLLCLISLMQAGSATALGADTQTSSSRKFVDELSCRKNDLRSCLRMALRHLMSPEGPRLLKAIAKRKLDSPTLSDGGAQIIAATMVFGKVIGSKDVLKSMCTQGNDTLACVVLVNSLTRGGTSASDHQEAEPFRAKALVRMDAECPAGDGFMCMMRLFLGTAIEGAGAQSSTDQMVVYLKRACALDEPAACLELGKNDLAHGESNNAMVLFRKSCDLGYGDGCFSVGSALKRQGKAPDALKFLQGKCAQEVGRACAYAAFLLSESGNEAEAEPLRIKACDLGDQDACFDFANALENKSRLADAKTHFRLLCEKDYSIACVRLGMILEGLGSREEAMKVLKAACDDDNGSACAQVGLIEIEKTRKPASLTKYFKKAKAAFTVQCNASDNDACNQLKTLLGIAKKFAISLE